MTKLKLLSAALIATAMVATPCHGSREQRSCAAAHHRNRRRRWLHSRSGRGRVCYPAVG